MDPRVRRLYKRLLFVSDYHPTIEARIVRRRVKEKFLENHRLKANSKAFKGALAYGKWWEKEIETLVQLHKYRQMKQRYAIEDLGPIHPERRLKKEGEDGGKLAE